MIEGGGGWHLLGWGHHRHHWAGVVMELGNMMLGWGSTVVVVVFVGGDDNDGGG